MTAEQMERAIEFLLDHQAQFAADISILKETQTELGATMKETQAEFRATMKEAQATLKKTLKTVDRISVRMEELTEAQIEMKREMTMLAKQQSRTSGELEHFMTAMQHFVMEVRGQLSK